MILKLSNKDIKSIVVCILLTVMMVYIYKFPFKKYSENFNEKVVVVDRLATIDKQLDNFQATKLKVEELEPRINEIVSGYKNFIVSNEEIINSYKSKVIAVLKQYDVTDFKESIKSLQANNANIILEFDFDITYDKLYRLLFDIEKFSIISKLNCTSNNVVFECSPMLHSSVLNDYFLGRQSQNASEVVKKGFFYEIANNVITSVNIGYSPSLKDLLPMPRNPFLKSTNKNIEQENVPVKQRVVKDVIKLPSFVLDGILYDEQNPVAIIEGNLYHVGKMYKENVKIKKINPSSIEVEYAGKLFKIKMSN